MMFVTIDTAQVFYKKYDAGNDAQTILILHGWGGSHSSWNTVASGLHKKGYTVVVPDIPGFGQSEMKKVYTIQDYADRAGKFIAELGLKEICMVGHSNGGRMSIQYMHDSGVGVDRLILVNAAAFSHPPTRRQKLFGVLAAIGKKLLCIPGMSFVRTCFYKCIGGHDYLYASKDTNPYKKQTFLNMIDTDHTDILPTIFSTTHIIRGKHDTYTPLTDGKRLHVSISGSTFVVHDDAKHGIHLTHPERLVEEIVSYM